MIFEEKIQQWVSLDNQLKILNEKVREIRDKKTNIGNSINTYIETNNLSNATIQISDGKLKFANTKVAPPLSFKYVEKSLGEIIHNEEQVTKIVNYLKKNRETKTVQELKRYHSSP